MLRYYHGLLLPNLPTTYPQAVSSIEVEFRVYFNIFKEVFHLKTWILVF